DESHFLKNIKAARTKAATPILKTRRWSFDLSEYHDFVAKVNAIDELHLEGLPYAVLKIFRNELSTKPEGNNLSNNKNNTDIDHDMLKDRIPDDLLAAMFPFQKDGVW
ncbi:unnamed protein product, partial [Trichobilharzia regenti]